ncbi:MAG: protein kinase, partial [Candidatus Eremiobacteraeota bacterium]|nr:protein kinase [Candidatus Eremiobacteraeota bacterium]
APASQRILPPGQNLISTFVCRDDPTIDGKTPCTVGPASSPAQQTNHQLPEAASVVPALAETLRGASYVEAAVWVASQLVAGLAHAHARGIVHRDVKPANVLISDDGTPMLLDFNLSDEAVVHGGQSLVVGGTLPYMAPEQLAAVSDGRRLAPQADLYAVGVILYELLTGERPYPDRR